MGKRAQQREGTRHRIVEAAIDCFAERGFRAASTREIAARAGANQGLITYHFQSKDALWRAAADRLFEHFRAEVEARRAAREALPEREQAREAVRDFVRFAAAHPEFFRFMLDAGKNDDERLQWLVETHVRPAYDRLPGAPVGPDDPGRTHAQYALVGAASLFFAVAPEVRHLTGLDPLDPATIENHADIVAALLGP